METECKSSWLITLMTRKVHISKSALIRIDNSSTSHRSTREFLLLLRVAGTFNSTACGMKRCRRHCRAGLPRSSTIPNQTPRGWLGKVGKVLQYLDKPAPNQRQTNPVGNAIGWLRVYLRGDQLTWHFQPSAQPCWKCTVSWKCTGRGSTPGRRRAGGGGV